MSGLVSVVIPCFNQGRFLAEAVASLQTQSYSAWEAVIVDDGSQDDTAEVAAALCREDARVHCFTKANGGLSSARNAGFERCRGEFIQFLDADDRLEERKLAWQVGVLHEQPGVEVVYGNAKYFADGDFGTFTRGPYARSPQHDWIAERWHEPAPLLDKLIVNNLFPVCSPLLRRLTLEKVGPFNDKLTALEDWEYWLRCAAAGVVFRYSGGAGTDALIRMHPASMTQDAERIMAAVYALRASCHEWLPPGKARTANLARLLPASARLDGEVRAAAHARLARSCSTWQERLLVRTNGYCAPGGPLNRIARRVARLLPDACRHALSTRGVQFE